MNKKAISNPSSVSTLSSLKEHFTIYLRKFSLNHTPDVSLPLWDLSAFYRQPLIQSNKGNQAFFL